MPVGDIHSNEIGAGARYNDGKVPLELIPASVIAGFYDAYSLPAPAVDWPRALDALGRFQMRDGHAMRALYEAIYWSGADWAACARVFHYGKTKYSKRDDCTCSAGNAVRERLSRGSAEATTSATFGGAAPTTRSASAPTAAPGTPATEKPSRNENAAGCEPPQTASVTGCATSNGSTASMPPTTRAWSPAVAPSADPRLGPMWTIATPAGESGACSAIPATLALDLSKGLMVGLNAHSPTCGVHRTPGSTGMWNWAKGMQWSVPIACAARHVVFGPLAGEDDDRESGEPHAGHFMCNVVMLLWFLEHYPEGDDRYVPPVRAA